MARVYDYDWLVIGSGFGGSVSALRLAEKGYRVGVLGCGRRFEDHEFAKTTWGLRRFLWAPKIGCYGIMRMNTLVCDGSAVPANPGVNPSLTITALAEHAMSHVPDNPAAPHLPPKVEAAPAPIHAARA
jgi:choline dehydrogenase-like flavoprotein